MPENTEQTGPQAGNEGEPLTDIEVQERIGQLEAKIEEANSRALRVMADFQNYQRRALQNEVVARQQGLASMAASVVGVLDHFDQALGQDTTTATAEQIVTGLKVIRDELIKALQQQGVGIINPAPNELFVPGRHEAIMQQTVEGIEPGHVVATFQTGYTLSAPANSPAGSERVLRPAKVAVAPTE